MQNRISGKKSGTSIIMIFDILYKLIRKSLPLNLYVSLRKSKIGGEKDYFTIGTYIDVYSYYKDQGLEVKGKVICEVGPGLQFFTAFQMLSDGAEKVLLVDPVFPEDISAFLHEQLKAYEKHTKHASGIDLNRISHFRSMTDLNSEWNHQIDFICSHTVLEHFTPLELFFSETKRLLKKSGTSINKVDLYDHTYYVFVKYPFIYKYFIGRELDYFKYSNNVFNLINDNKCYMNRIPLPVYKKYAATHGLMIDKLDPTFNIKSVMPHKDIFNNYEIVPELLEVVNFTLCLKNH